MEFFSIGNKVGHAGVDDELAARLSRVRIFGTPAGAYGPGLETPITTETSWSEESELAEVYFSRLGHLFGQGFWGGQPQTGDSSGKQLAIDLFRGALSGADAVVHSRSSNLYGVLDNDDFYQALGGAAMAVRVIDGTTPATRVTDLSDPRGGRMVALETYLGQELQSRYLNPEWIDAMLDEGYAGARFVRDIADNLWGWQVTVPAAVGASRWQSFHEVYVEDRYDLDVVERIDAAGKLEAYAALLDRLESVVEKGYWSPDTATLNAIREAAQAVAARLASQQAPGPTSVEAGSGAAPGPPVDASAPDAARAESPAGVSGRQMERVSPAPEGISESASSPLPMMLVLFALCFFGLGWWRQGTILENSVQRTVSVGVSLSFYERWRPQTSGLMAHGSWLRTRMRQFSQALLELPFNSGFRERLHSLPVTALRPGASTAKTPSPGS